VKKSPTACDHRAESKVRGQGGQGVVLRVDTFGNLMTNLTTEKFRLGH